jgi:hypothetical protein
VLRHLKEVADEDKVMEADALAKTLTRFAEERNFLIFVRMEESYLRQLCADSIWVAAIYWPVRADIS